MAGNIAYNNIPNAVRNGFKERESSFHRFFECWIAEQNQHLQELVSASKEHDKRIQTQILERVVHHYERYYKAKSKCAKKDVLSMFNPSWVSSLEDAFLWIGGWRPNMALHLLYSKSGLQLEARLTELINGMSSSVELGGLTLTSTQMRQVDELQRRTVWEEKEITEKLAKQQERLAETSMVELTHAMSELIRDGKNMDDDDYDGRVEGVLAPREEGLVEILQRADDLRLKTLKEVIKILSPSQGVHFLIAAAELHLRVHEWGQKREKHA